MNDHAISEEVEEVRQLSLKINNLALMINLQTKANIKIKHHAREVKWDPILSFDFVVNFDDCSYGNLGRCNFKHFREEKMVPGCVGFMVLLEF